MTASLTTSPRLDWQMTRPAHPEVDLSLVPVAAPGDILSGYRGNPVGELLAAHNLGQVLHPTPDASMLIITCMDHRVTLDVPEFFAFQIRTAGATPRPVFANVAYAVGVAGVRAICVVGHTDCAMCRIDRDEDRLIERLVEREGWLRADARDQMILLRQVFRIDDPMTATWCHARLLAERFPSCVIAPLLYSIEDGQLLQIVSDP